MGKRSRYFGDRWEAVEAFFLHASAWQQGLLHFWRERILLVVCLISVVVGFFALIPSVGLAIKEKLWAVAVLDTLAYLALILILLAKLIPFQVRAWITCAVLYLLGLGLSLFLGLIGAAYIWLFAFAIFAGLLLGIKAGIISLGLNAATLSLVGVLIYADLLPWSRLLENPLEKWAVIGASVLLINAIVTLSIALILRGMEQALEREQGAVRSLGEEHQRLVDVNLRLKNEMDERLEAEQALRRSEKRFRDLFNSISDLIYTQDLDGRFISVNPALSQTFGYSREELIGAEASRFMHPDFREAFRSEYLERMKRDGKYEGISLYFSKGGDPRYIEYRSRLIIPDEGEPYISGSGRDVTERVLAEREMEALQGQLQQAKKMEAVGTLAGGIAHDFNNILAAIMGYSELGLDSALEGKATPGEIRQIIKAAERAKELVSQILAFSRKAASRQEPLNLNKVILDTVPIIERTIPKMISVELQLAPDLPPINGDHTQIEQILLNLASNARDAMPDGGKLSLKTENVSLDREYVNTHLEAVSGDYVLMTVSDTGQGMDKDDLEHIFEPFYTTKEVGKGTGLGLASVYGIVKSHKGHITCYSQPGQGSAFNIYWPKLKSGGKPAGTQVPDTDFNTEGKENVLLVDDEQDLRQVGSRILEAQGYQVATASSGEEALDIYRAPGPPLDLVILDVGMPGMGGRKALEELLSINPNAKVIIASGYPASGSVEQIIASGAAGYISKPFRKADLLKTVRDILDA